MGVVRTQIQLPEAQYRRLKSIAHQQGISLAELIRRLVDHGLRGGTADRAALFVRAAALVGAFRAGEDDLSENHDRHLDDALS